MKFEVMQLEVLVTEPSRHTVLLSYKKENYHW